METGDWVISFVIGIVGLVVGLALENIGRAILREVCEIRSALEEVTVSLEGLERLLDIPQEAVEPDD